VEDGSLATWCVIVAIPFSACQRSNPAVVAFYPRSDLPRSVLVTDTLILIGEADDWTPADRCARWRDAVQSNGHTVWVKTNPGALHSFDAPAMPHAFVGHTIGRNPEAAADALAETRAFLAVRLGPRS
jgi:dienelactone hydrolase